MLNYNETFSLLDLKSDITDEEIILCYFGNFELGEKYPSPFRKEGDPSFLLYYANDKLQWKDFGKTKGDTGGDAIQFVRELPEHSNKPFEILIDEIYKTVSKKNNKLRAQIIRKHNITTDLKFSIRKKWKQTELEYWMQYGITLKTLSLYNVLPATKIWINGLLHHSSTEEDPIFLYRYGPDNVKSYRPYAPDKSNKWKSKNINDIIQGFDQLPWTGDIIIITSSLKDVMMFHELGISAIALNSETSILKEDLVIRLRKRFKRIIVNYDNDVTGVESSIKYSNLYGLEYWNVPLKYKDCTDPSDLFLNHGLNTLREELNKKSIF